MKDFGNLNDKYTLCAVCGSRNHVAPDHERLNDAAPDLLEACRFVKAFFQKLEDNTDDNDPLLAIRQRFHAPVHKVLDAAIAKAERKTP
jgi:hypothetical protein